MKAGYVHHAASSKVVQPLAPSLDMPIAGRREVTFAITPSKVTPRDMHRHLPMDLEVLFRGMESYQTPQQGLDLPLRLQDICTLAG